MFDLDEIIGMVLTFDGRDIQIMVVLFDKQVVIRYLDTFKIEDVPLSELIMKSNLSEIVDLES